MIIKSKWQGKRNHHSDMYSVNKSTIMTRKSWKSKMISLNLIETFSSLDPNAQEVIWPLFKLESIKIRV